MMSSLKNVLVSLVLFSCISFIPATFANEKSNETSLQSFDSLIASHKGKVIYLDFWASWCGPCRKSFPWMNDIQQQYQQQGLVVISVNVDNQKSLAEEFLNEIPANFTVFYDPKGKVARKFKLKGMPSSYLIDRSGKMVATHVGFSKSKSSHYEQEIKALLNQKN
ncbi:MAG: TlpA family protein disulfide reductase [Colwellia sp.]|nr:TlpA family protein disulfide reductase [Colwellia sp.]